MIDVNRASTQLRRRYPNLERLSDFVFRGVDLHEGQPYAIRYFDLRDDVRAAAEGLQEYQDTLLGKSYYHADSRSDLRWNHYLYFVADATQFSDEAFLKAKAAVEANRDYARKMVLPESGLEEVIHGRAFGIDSAQPLPPDPLSIWSTVLEKHSLGFIVDESLQVPAIVNHIADGSAQGLRRPPASPVLDASEIAASNEFLARIVIQGFRQYPLRKTFDFGIVNLVSGVNGVGKTSLLEAIEYLFCRKTRRTEKPVLPATVVSGTWADSRKELETRESTSAAKLRARHLVWYGKAELRTLTLDESFAKFNFLDTDAAVRLTVDSSRERVSEDLFQLLLGSGSAKALDRLERVLGRLEESRRSIEKDIGSRDLRRTDAVARADGLRRVPHESDHLFSELINALARVGWTQPPNNKGENEKLGEALQTALTNARVLRTAEGSRSAVDPESSLADLLRLDKELKEFSKKESQNRKDEERTRAQALSLGKRIAAIEALAPAVESGILELSKSRDSLRQRVAQLSARMTDVDASLADLPADLSQGRTSLQSAIDRWAAHVNEAAATMGRARQMLTALERVQALVTNAEQRLRSAAMEIIRETQDSTHCPLCRTVFDGSQLMDRLEETNAGIQTADSDRLRSDVQAAESMHIQRTSELGALRALQSFVGGTEKTSVAAALRLVASERGQLTEAKRELEAAELAVRSQEQMGWTVARLRELSTAAGSLDPSTSVEALEASRLQALAEQSTLTASLAKLESEARDVRERAAQVAITSGLTAKTLTDLQKEVSARIRSGESTLKAARALEVQLKSDANVSDEEIEARLIQAHDLVIRLRTALEREQEGDQALAREVKLASDAADEIAGLRVKLARVDSAHVVIKDLLAKQSERILVDQVLRENAATIASTFAKIHAPNEFDVVVGDGLRIVRRPGGNSVELEEMSSGQRAAYALSLFLAMNERLRTGPKVLIFDDPVSHVDDTNTLSFLDHLRDIALTGKRQIFFATADAKLSGLFVRKFRFLGDQKFKQVDLTREQ